MKFSTAFTRFAQSAARFTGKPLCFALAASLIVVWALTGPIFQFNNTWQLVINTGTTIVTFLMVFLIQHSQNKDSLAIHIKLNELLAAAEHASNRVVAIEDLDESDLATLREFYCELALQAEAEGGVKFSHSLDEARSLIDRKRHARTPATSRTPASEVA